MSVMYSSPPHHLISALCQHWVQQQAEGGWRCVHSFWTRGRAWRYPTAEGWSHCLVPPSMDTHRSVNQSSFIYTAPFQPIKKQFKVLCKVTSLNIQTFGDLIKITIQRWVTSSDVLRTESPVLSHWETQQHRAVSSAQHPLAPVYTRDYRLASLKEFILSQRI